MAGLYAAMDELYMMGPDVPGVTARGRAWSTNWAGLQVSVDATVLPIITKHFTRYATIIEAVLLKDLKYEVEGTVALNLPLAMKREVKMWFNHNKVEDGRLIRVNVLRVEVLFPNDPNEPMTWRWDL